MKNGYETIDLYEHPRYREIFDFAGELGERVIDAAGSHYGALLDESGCWDLLTDILSDYFWPGGVEEGPKDWSPKTPEKVGHRGVELLCEALRKGELDETDLFIRDSLTFAWEKAMLPTYRDISYAVGDATQQVAREYGLGNIWLPLLNNTEDEAAETGRILDSLMAKVYWMDDMFGETKLYFKFGDASAVWALKELDKSVTNEALDREFSYIRDDVMEAIFLNLEKALGDSSPENRVDWKKQWKEELKDKKRVEAVQKELREYLKGRRFA